MSIRTRAAAVIVGAALLAPAAPATAIRDPEDFTGKGRNTVGEALAVKATEGPRRSTATYLPAGSGTRTDLALFCVRVDIARTGGGTLYAAGRSPAGQVFLLRAQDAGIGNPELRDGFGVLALPVGSAPPAGIGNPDLFCAAAAVDVHPLVAGDFRAIGDPNI